MNRFQLNVFERAILLDALREHKKANQKMTTCSIDAVSHMSEFVIMICDNLIKELKSIELT